MLEEDQSVHLVVIPWQVGLWPVRNAVDVRPSGDAIALGTLDMTIGTQEH